MLGSFKMRFLFVMVLLATLGLIMQSNHGSKKVVEPVLQYIMETDYTRDLGTTLSVFFNQGHAEEKSDSMPVLGNTALHMPCSFINIEKNYGWYWNKQDKQQQFFPGIYLQVKENTLVNPVLDGQVMEIKREEKSSTIKVKHSEEFYSVYGGLKEVLVEMNDELKTNTVLGKTGETFYFEVRTGEGPVDPHSIFQ